MKPMRVLTITCCLLLTTAIAHGHELRPPRTVSSPIGTIQAFGSVIINGRAVQKGDTYWNFDLIECLQNSSARITLPNLGEILVSSGTTARFSIDGQYVVVASVSAGSVNIKLRDSVEGVITARGRIYQTSAGSELNVKARNDRTELRFSKGAIVRELDDQQIMPVKVSIDRQFKARTNAAVTVRARVTRQTARATSMASYFQQPEEPVANTPVRFDLDPPALGLPNPVRVMTDSQGYATTIVTAGANSGSGKLRATAEESGAYAEADFTVRSAAGSWIKDPGKLIAIGGAAAAIVVPIVIVGGEEKKITAIGNPVIKP